MDNKPESTDYEVAVVGAGPAGLVCALKLSENGIKTVVLDKKKEIGYPVCCGEGISDYALKMSGIYDASYIDSSFDGYRIYFPGGKSFFVKSKGHIINRDVFENYLYAAALSNGADIKLKSGILKAERDNNTYKLHTKDSVISSKYLIGADGPDSFVDKTFFSNESILLQAVQYKFDSQNCPNLPSDNMCFYYTKLAPYYFWVFRKQNEINIGGVVSSKETLDKFIKEELKCVLPEPLSFTRGRIPFGGIKKCIQKGNVLLIGDAAGLTNPATFAGIYTAIISGSTAADAIINYNSNESSNYEKLMKKKLFASKRVFNTSRSCFSYPDKILEFIGDYFNGRDFMTKDYKKFLSMTLKEPSILRHSPSLIFTRQLLKYHADEMW